MRTAFTELVGCSLPLQLAAMGGAGTAELAAAVARAGGLGMVPFTVDPPVDAGPVGKNFLTVFRPNLDAVAEAARKAAIVEFFYSWPERAYVEAAKSAGGLAAWQVGSAEEAQAAEAAGCDLVIAQGIEAGGHIRGTSGLDRLLPEVLDAVGIPVLAAGGIATPRRVAELLRAGAAGVRVGTLFLATPESGAHPRYIQHLIDATAEDTVVTGHFDEGWPDAPVRVLRSSLEAAAAAGWRSTIPPIRGAVGDVEAMAMYAGMGVDRVRQVRPAADLVSELCADL